MLQRAVAVEQIQDFPFARARDHPDLPFSR